MAELEAPCKLPACGIARYLLGFKNNNKGDYDGSVNANFTGLLNLLYGRSIDHGRLGTWRDDILVPHAFSVVTPAGRRRKISHTQSRSSTILAPFNTAHLRHCGIMHSRPHAIDRSPHVESLRRSSYGLEARTAPTAGQSGLRPRV